MFSKQLILNNYKVFKYIACGSFTHCVLASHPVHNKCALLISKDREDLEYRMNFQTQFSHLKCMSKAFEFFKVNITNQEKLTADKIIPGVLQEGKQFVLATEYYETSFSQYMKASPRTQKNEMFRKLMAALADWHSQKYFHLDLKPANIFVVNNEPVLIDFGLSYYPGCQISQLPVVDPLMDPRKEVVISSLKNTGAYAPKHDVYQGYIAASKFDVYCIGAMLYEDLVGSLPNGPIKRESKSFNKLNQTLGPHAADLLAGMLDHDQAKRYSLPQAINHPYFFKNSKVSDLQKFQFSVNASNFRTINKSQNVIYQRLFVDDIQIEVLSKQLLFDDQQPIKSLKYSNLIFRNCNGLLNNLRQQLIFQPNIILYKTQIQSYFENSSYSVEAKSNQKLVNAKICKPPKIFIQRALQISLSEISTEFQTPTYLSSVLSNNFLLSPKQYQSDVRCSVSSIRLSVLHTPKQADISYGSDDIQF
ncbi:Kinase [Hexamita inflata]|uniref:CAMK CAMKL n=1 Tax=Hexamita inflata TaxID=28002 RepID=A0AA86PV04_9EUKA|nr:CAMK CAMKL [Hexamita inflata]